MDSSIDTSERLHRDIHPAEAYAPHAMTGPAKARVFITNQRIQIWAEREGGPTMILEAPITTDVERDRGSLFGQITVDTAEGPVHITKGRGCGCHSVLKALSPPASW